MPVSLESLAADLDIVELRSPLAPGLHIAFGRWTGTGIPVTPLSTGKGPDAASARLGCLGELVENLSIGVAAHPLPIWGATDAGRVDARACDLTDATDLGSEGCAAHSNPDLARKGAVLERIERAALALWWQGQAEASEIGIDPDLLARYRQGETRRWSRCWQVAAVPGIATCLVITGDVNGGGLVLGSAAADTAAAACEAALAEALLSEVALLAPPDHPDHRQALAMDRALQNRIGTTRGRVVPQQGPALSVGDLVGLCRGAGHDMALVDLTNPALGVPVWRAVSTTLPRWRPLLRGTFDV